MSRSHTLCSLMILLSVCFATTASARSPLPPEEFVNQDQDVAYEYDYSMYYSPDCVYYTTEPATSYGFPIRNRCQDMILTLQQFDDQSGSEQVFASTEFSEDTWVHLDGLPAAPGDSYDFIWTLEQEQDGALVVVDSGFMTVEYLPLADPLDSYDECADGCPDYDLGDDNGSGGLPRFLSGCSATGTQGPEDFSLLGVLLGMAGMVALRRRR